MRDKLLAQLKNLGDLSLMKMLKNFWFVLALGIAMPLFTLMAQDTPQPSAEAADPLKFDKETMSTSLWSLIFFPPKSFFKSVISESTLQTYARGLDTEVKPEDVAAALEWITARSTELQLKQTINFCQTHADDINCYLTSLARHVSTEKEISLTKEDASIILRHDSNFKTWRMQTLMAEMLVTFMYFQEKGALPQDIDLTKMLGNAVKAPAAIAAMKDLLEHEKNEGFQWPINLFDASKNAETRRVFNSILPDAVARILNGAKLYPLDEQIHIFFESMPSQAEGARKAQSDSQRPSFVISVSDLYLDPMNAESIHLNISIRAHQQLYLASKRYRTKSTEQKLSTIESAFITSIGTEEFLRYSSATTAIKEAVKDAANYHRQRDPLADLVASVTKRIILKEGFSGIQRLVEFLQDGRIDERLVAEGADAVLKLLKE